MPTIEQVTDGDTLVADGDKIRVGYINTPESVHKNKDLNTEEGKVASQFAKDVLPEGSKVVEHDYGNDHFGRSVKGVKRVINGVEIDYGLVALDQQMSTYYTKHGTHPDPLAHDQYKEYYSADVPYQFGTSEEPLTTEQFADMDMKQNIFRTTYSRFKEGEATQEDLDQATVDLYKDPNLVMRYRHQLQNWNKPAEKENPYSIRGSMKLAMEQDPELRDVYNRAVRNGHLMQQPIPEEEPSFWEKAKLSVSMFNDIGNITEADTLFDARRLGIDVGIPDTELTKGIPEHLHSDVLHQATKYNDAAALVYRDQLIDDLANEKAFDNMEWYAQFGYGALGYASSPSTWITGGLLTAPVKAGMQKATTWSTNRLIQNVSKMATWTAAGTAEGTVVNLPQLAADHTYTARDYFVDVAFDAAFGLGIGAAVEYAAKPLFKYSTDLRKSRKIEQEQIKALTEKEPVEQGLEPAETPELQVVQDKAVEASRPMQARKITAEVTGLEFTPWEAVTDVSSQGFKLAHETLKSVHKDKTPIRMLMNRQEKLNRTDLPDEVKAEVTKLNADILHLASAFPDGKVPKSVGKSINAVTFKQKQFVKKNAISDILQGNKADVKLELAGYINALKGHKELWDGLDVQPVSRQAFIRQNADLMDIQVERVTDDAVISMQKTLHPHASFVNDVKQLNDMIKDSKDRDLVELVEQLNGMVAARLEQFYTADAPNFVPSNKRWTKSVAMSPQEIAAQLKKEGLVPRTSEYSKRLKELRKTGRVEVTEDVQSVGKLDQYEVGREITTVDLDAVDYYSIDDAKKELSNLQKKPDPTQADVLRAKGLRSIIDSNKQSKSKTLFAEKIDQDLLPRGYTKVDSLDVYNEPTLHNLKVMRERLNTDIIKKLGLKVLKGKTEYKNIQRRLEVISKAMQADKKRVFDRMLKAGQWQNVEDVIRVAHTLAEAKKKKPKVEGVEQPKVTELTEEDIEKVNRQKETREYIRNLPTIELEEMAYGSIEFIHKGKSIGYSDAKVQEGSDLLAMSPDIEKGKGFGSASYLSLAKAYPDRRLESSIDLSPDAEALWKRFYDKGLAERTVFKEYSPTDIQYIYKLKSWNTIDAEFLKVEDKGKATPEIRLTEEHLLAVQDSNSGVLTEKLSEEEWVEVNKVLEESQNKLQEESNQKVTEHLGNFVASGEKEAMQLAKKPTGMLDSGGRMAARITKDLAERFLDGKLTALEFVGSRLTEIGRGFGGNIRRKATAGVIKQHKLYEGMMQLAPQYVRAMDEYAASKGLGKLRRMAAQQKAGADNKVVDQFNRDVFRVQEYRRQGEPIPESIHPSVMKYIDNSWDKYMDYAHDELVGNGIAGFTKERKVKHYIPHIWIPTHLQAAISKHGLEKVNKVFIQAYLQVGNNLSDATDLAKRQIDWIMKRAPDQDMYLPTIDGRAKQRLELDTTAEVDGLSILDLLDTEVMSIGTKYANRVSGWTALARSTDGAITSELDLATLKQHIIQEGKEKGVDTAKYEQFYDDVVNLLFGRPTRGGLNQELRQLKDLTALTRMGGLGTAQAIETGQVITRSVLSTFSSEPVVKKVFKMARVTEGAEGDLMREIQSISSITDDIEWMDRQSVHLDQEELAKSNKARQLSLWIADKATGGSLKAPASRLLGKTTGYNMVRRMQSRTVQASYAIDVAKHFKNKSSKMGTARLADLGLTDVDGVDLDLQEAFDKFVEWDDNGLPKKLNVDKWSKEAVNKFALGMVRDEAQQIQRTLVGEMPPWLNRPMLALILQFRQMPIVANNKQLSRAMAFADKEAVTAVMLNTAIAGLVRYSKFAALGLGVKAITDNEWQEPNEGQMQVDKYITQAGIYPDAADLVMSAYKAGTTGDYKDLAGQVPVMGLMNDYRNAISEPVGAKKQIDASFGLLPLGNTAYGDMIHTWIQEEFGE